MRRRLGLILCVLIALGSSVSTSAAKFIPPDNKVLLLIGQDRESIAAYAREMNTVPAGVMFYTSIQLLTGLTEPKDYGAGYQDAAALLRDYPDAVLQIGLYMVGTLPDILTGKYDANIERFGRWLAGTRRPVYLRIGYEFDLPENSYSPAVYREAYRYLVDRWRSMGVTNVAYVWHSYGVITPETPFMEWYPGDDYVDWLGVSFFRVYNVPDAEVFAGLAKQLRKPLMIAEASPNREIPAEGEVRWERWYQRLFDFARQYDARVISYINCDWDSFPMWKGQSWGDSRVEIDPVLRDRWRAETGDLRYLRTSPTLFRDLGF